MTEQRLEIRRKFRDRGLNECLRLGCGHGHRSVRMWVATAAMFELNRVRKVNSLSLHDELRSNRDVWARYCREASVSNPCKHQKNYEKRKK